MRKKFTSLFTAFTFTIILFGCNDIEEYNKNILENSNPEITDNTVNDVRIEGKVKLTNKDLFSFINEKDKKINLKNEFGSSWNGYNNHYNDFYLYDNKGSLFTTDDIFNLNGISVGSSFNDVKKALGEPIQYIIKDNTQYDITDDYNVTYLIDNYYITIFFDSFKNNTVRSFLLVPKSIEENKEGYYGNNLYSMQEDSEKLMVELINEFRVNNKLKPLIHDYKITSTLREHSTDMIVNNFFDHKGSDGSSPSDRLIKNGFNFSLYVENLAYGQTNAITANEALLNSKGHRINMLNKDVTHVSVGVEFSKENRPYFTINFYKK